VPSQIEYQHVRIARTRFETMTETNEIRSIGLTGVRCIREKTSCMVYFVFGRYVRYTHWHVGTLYIICINWISEERVSWPRSLWPVGRPKARGMSTLISNNNAGYYAYIPFWRRLAFYTLYYYKSAILYYYLFRVWRVRSVRTLA